MVPGRSGIIFQQEEGVEIQDDGVIIIQVGIIPLNMLVIIFQDMHAHTELFDIARLAGCVFPQSFL